MGIFGRDEETPDQQPEQSKIKPTKPQTTPEVMDRTVIASPSKIEGRISGSGEIIVDGSVNGTIDATGTVRVGEKGRIEAAVHGKVVSVAGTVEGDITADDKIELEISARVDGNITAPRILIKDGANFRGQVNMKKPESRPSLRTSSARKDPGELPK